MARHGENIRKRTDGRWEGRYGAYSKEKKKTIYKSVYGKSYQDAKEKLTLKKNLSENQEKTSNIKEIKETQPALGNISFGDTAAGWLSEVKKTKKLSTYVKYWQVYKNHIEGLFRDYMLSDITDVAVRAKLSHAENGGELSDSMIKSIYCVLNQVLKFASRHYLVSAPSLKKPSSGARSKPVQALSTKEQIKLFSALQRDMDIFKLAVFLCLHTGLRLGELCALKWSDIDFKNKILSVDRTVQRLYVKGNKTKTTLWEAEPKSGYSRREIPLSDEMARLLFKFGNGREYIFGGDKPLEPRTMQNHFRKILAEAGLDNKNFHILRHTFATNCVEGGVDAKSLSEMLGHSDVRITLDRYVHSSIDAKRRYMDSLCVFYGQIYGQVS